MSNKKSINQILAKRILILAILVGTSVVIMIRFAPKIGSLFGRISVNRNATITTPKPNTPPPIFIEIPRSVNKTKINLRGLSSPKTKIELYVNGPKKQEVLTDTSGEFLFTDVVLNKGKNTIFAKVADSENSKSDVITIRYDDEKPEIEIETPKNDEIIENLDERIVIKGEVNEEADIRINDKVAIQKPDNSFSLLLGVKEGEVKITIEATDLAGNKTEETIKVFYRKK